MCVFVCVHMNAFVYIYIYENMCVYTFKLWCNKQFQTMTAARDKATTSLQVLCASNFVATCIMYEHMPYLKACKLAYTYVCMHACQCSLS